MNWQLWGKEDQRQPRSARPTRSGRGPVVEGARPGFRAPGLPLVCATSRLGPWDLGCQLRHPRLYMGDLGPCQ